MIYSLKDRLTKEPILQILDNILDQTEYIAYLLSKNYYAIQNEFENVFRKYSLADDCIVSSSVLDIAYNPLNKNLIRHCVFENIINNIEKNNTDNLFAIFHVYITSKKIERCTEFINTQDFIDLIDYLETLLPSVNNMQYPIFLTEFKQISFPINYNIEFNYENIKLKQNEHGNYSSLKIPITVYLRSMDENYNLQNFVNISRLSLRELMSVYDTEYKELYSEKVFENPKNLLF